ncbi:ROK family protein [Patescibacteria group bacterium]
MTAQTDSWIANSIIYQVFVGRWESANIIDHEGQVFNRLKNIPFENLKKIGVNTIYLLGIFDNQGPIIVSEEEGQNLNTAPNRCPSVFAISNHKSTNPKLGTTNEFRELISLLKSKGFHIIVDFVPNHTGTTHPWIKDHPKYYLQKNGKIITEFSQDVCKLDYSNQELREEIIQVLETIIDWGVDGFRCDMAHLIPGDFWSSTIQKLKSEYRNLIFIAEAYSNSIFDLNLTKEMIRLGFDGVYHAALYENIKKVYENNKPESYLNDHLSYIKSRTDIRDHLVNYLSNHDDGLPKGAENHLNELLQKILKQPGSALIFNGLINGQMERLAHHYIEILSDKKNETFNISDKSMKIFSIRNSRSVISLDIGASKIESAVVNDEFEINNTDKQPTNKNSFQDFTNQIKSVINTHLENNPSAHAISIALPGIISQSGIVRFSGGSLPFLSQKNLKLELEKHFELPIFLENDANCFALGEAVMGAGRNYSTVFGITWGTGIGSGIVIDQKLFEGAGAAGEIGHIPITTSNQSITCGCGKSNCLEIYASGSAIQNQYKEMGGEIENASVQDIVNSKEAIAIALIDQAVEYLAEIIAASIDMMNPEIIIIGGGLSQIEEGVFSKLKRTVRKHEINSIQKTIIVKKELPNAALIGAALIARQENEPS